MRVTPQIIQVIGYDQWEKQWFGVPIFQETIGNLCMSISELIWSWNGFERLHLMPWRT